MNVAAILLSIGNGGIEALQSFIVVTAVPVSLILAPMCLGSAQGGWITGLRTGNC